MSTLTTFHVWNNNKSSGPFTVRAMQEMLRSGMIDSQTLVVRSGDDEWLPLGAFDDLVSPSAAPVTVPRAVAASGAHGPWGAVILAIVGVIVCVGVWQVLGFNLDDHGAHVAGIVIGGIIVCLVYFLPTFIAAGRGTEKKNLIFVLNLFTGVTIIGWVAAFIWAAVDKREHRS